VKINKHIFYYIYSNFLFLNSQKYGQALKVLKFMPK